MSVEEKEIQKLQDKLDLMQLLDGKKPSEAVSRFRAHVLDVHSDIELSLATLIVKNIYTTCNPHFRKNGVSSFKEARELIEKKLLKGQNYTSLMLKAWDMEIISQETFKDLDFVNQLRVTCAHPLTRKLIFYEGPDGAERMRLAYETIIRVLGDLAKEDLDFELNIYTK